jgi:hypothetical protein
MSTTKERRPAFRTLEGWAIGILLAAGAIRECDEHGYMKDRADPHARDEAVETAREEPFPGLSSDQAAAAVQDVLNEIGDTCPGCS